MEMIGLQGEEMVWCEGMEPYEGMEQYEGMRHSEGMKSSEAKQSGWTNLLSLNSGGKHLHCCMVNTGDLNTNDNQENECKAHLLWNSNSPWLHGAMTCDWLVHSRVSQVTDVS